MTVNLRPAPTGAYCEICGFGIATGTTAAITSAGHAHPVCALEALPIHPCTTCAAPRPHRVIPGLGMLCDACGTPS